MEIPQKKTPKADQKAKEASEAKYVANCRKYTLSISPSAGVVDMEPEAQAYLVELAQSFAFRILSLANESRKREDAEIKTIRERHIWEAARSTLTSIPRLSQNSTDVFPKSKKT